MRILYACVLAVIVAVVGLGLYWQHRLASVMDSPTARLVPAPLVIRASTSARHIDLGYVKFDLPARIPGDILEQGDSLFFTIGDPKTPKHFCTICPLVSDHTPQIQSLLDQFERVSGERFETHWELERASLFAQPFSVWTIPFRGRRRSAGDAMLLLMKTLTTYQAESVLFYENDSIAAVVSLRPALGVIGITDKRNGAEQHFMVSPADAAEIASMLVQTYRIQTTDFNRVSLLRLASLAGIRRRAMPAPAESTNVDLASESARLQAIIKEVRKRHDAASGH